LPVEIVNVFGLFVPLFSTGIREYAQLLMNLVQISEAKACIMGGMSSKEKESQFFFI
jgi:hypothetical protein